jgi:hypothetical protein
MMVSDDEPKASAVQFMNNMLERYNYWMMLRIFAWIIRFRDNCTDVKHTGPLRAGSSWHKPTMT